MFPVRIPETTAAIPMQRVQSVVIQPTSLRPEDLIQIKTRPGRQGLRNRIMINQPVPITGLRSSIIQGITTGTLPEISTIIETATGTLQVPLIIAEATTRVLPAEASALRQDQLRQAAALVEEVHLRDQAEGQDKFCVLHDL